MTILNSSKLFIHVEDKFPDFGPEGSFFESGASLKGCASDTGRYHTMSGNVIHVMKCHRMPENGRV